MLKISCTCVKIVLAIDSKGKSTPEILEQISYISTEQDEILIIKENLPSTCKHKDTFLRENDRHAEHKCAWGVLIR